MSRPPVSERGPSDLAVALATPADPCDPGAYSGWPASLLDGLRAVVGRVHSPSGALPPPVRAFAELAGAAARLQPGDLLRPRGLLARRLPAAAFLGAPLVHARSAALRAQLRRAGPVDGWVTLGTELWPPRGVRFVTFQDSTLAQAFRSYRWAYLGDMTRRDRARAIARQRRVYERAVACCTSSRWAAESIVDEYGIPPEKVQVVGIGRNTDVSPPAERDWSTPRFLFVGFDWERKNGDALVAAFADLRRAIPSATLDVVGGHPPLDVPGVTGHGRLRLGDPADSARLAALFRRATCFAMVSLHEPSATAYAEAAAAGIPSIGTTHGGSATVIGPGGILVDPGDRRALADALRRLADPATARRLGTLARRNAETLTWERVAGRLIRALAPPGCRLDDLPSFL